MAHNARINTDAFYANGVALPAAYWQSVDNAQLASVNGDAGGTWNPSAPLVIGGAGVLFASAWHLTGGNITNPASSGARLVHNADDYILLGTGHSGQSRQFVSCFACGVDASAQSSAFAPSFRYAAQLDATDAWRTVQQGGRLIVPLRAHHFSTFASVVLSIKVSVAHNGVGSGPASMPSWRVFSVDASGNVQNLSTNAAQSGWLGNGFVQLAPLANGTSWYFGGVPRNYTYTIDNGVVMDTSLYTYFAEIVDESGANSFAGNEYLVLQTSASGILDLRFQ